MPPQLEVYLLGGLQLLLRGAKITQFRSQKVPLLLAYLLSQRKRPPSRIEITTALFPEQDEGRGRSNLRTTLFRLKQALGTDHLDRDPWLNISAQSIGFNWSADYWLDVEAFEALCQQSTEAPELDYDLSLQAINMYRGDFLAGFYEEWSLTEAARLRTLYQNLLGTVAEHEAAHCLFVQSVSHLREQLALCPFDEALHRRLISLFLEQGDTVSAMSQYKLCERLLATEMGIAPSQETQELQSHWRSAKQRRPLPEQVAYGQLEFGRQALEEGHHIQAERSLQMAKRSLGQLHAPEELEAIYQLGRVALKDQHLGLAHRRFTQLRRRSKAAGHTEFHALALNALGATEAAFDHLDQAKSNYEAAVRLAQQGHHPDVEWRALSNLGRNHLIQGRYDESLRCYLRGQVLCEHLKHPTGARIIQQNLGTLYSYLGLFEEAHHCFESARALLEHDPNPMKLRSLWTNWGDVYERQEAYGDAETCYRQGYKTCWGVKDDWGCTVTLINLASVSRALGNLRYAARLLDRIIPAVKTAKQTRLFLEATVVLAQVRQAQGQIRQAQALIHEALELLKSGVPYEEPDKIHLAHADILLALGERDKAFRALTTAWELLEQRAARIDSLRYRTSFLENVPLHRKIKQQLQSMTTMPR